MVGDCFFFFQAEDGIRDLTVTGVQTCALPISFALARQLGISQDQAKAFIAEYFARFAGVRTWLDRTVAEARERGYVETLFGRRRYIPELKDRNFNIRAFGERTATNSPLPRSAADLIKIAMI